MPRRRGTAIRQGRVGQGVVVQLVTETRASALLVRDAIDASLLIGLRFAFVFAAFGSQEGNLATAAASKATNRSARWG